MFLRCLPCLVCAAMVIYGPSIEPCNADGPSKTVGPSKTEGPSKAEGPSKTKSQAAAERDLERGIKLRKERKYARAATILRHALTRNPPEDLAGTLLFEVGQAQFLMAKESLDRDRRAAGEKLLRETLGIFQSVMKNYPNARRTASASYMTGSIYLLLGEPQKALQAYRQTFVRYRQYASRSRVLLRVGVALVNLDRIPEAVATFGRVIREFPERTGDAATASKYIEQLAMVGRKFTPLRAGTWLNNLVDDEGLASFEGEVIVLVFLATWCSSCTDEIPHLRRLIKRWSDKGVVFIGALNPNDPKNTEPVVLYVEKSDLDFLDVALVDNQRAWDAYRARRLPAAVVIDRRGIVRWRGHPAMFPTYLTDKALAE